MLINRENFDTLSNSELSELLVKAQGGDIAARNRIVNCNLKLILFYIGKLHLKSHIDEADLFSVGVLALMSAIEKYDFNAGAKFSTYAYITIRGAIVRFLSKQDEYVSLFEDKEMVFGDDNVGTWNYLDLITDEFDLQDSIDDKDLLTKLYEAFDCLDADTKRALKIYFGFYDGKKHTIKETAFMMGITYGKARGFVERGVSKLRTLLMEKGYNSSNTTDISRYCKKYF